MLTLFDQQKYTSELQEVHVLLRLERMLDEKWNDLFEQVIQASYAVSHSVAVVRANHAAPEIGFKRVEYLDVSLMLDDGKLRQNLGFGCHAGVCINTDVETTFTVDKADDPLCIKFQRKTLPNVKSLRIPGLDPGLSCGLSTCLTDCYYHVCDEYRKALEDFPAYGSVSPRLAVS